MSHRLRELRLQGLLDGRPRLGPQTVHFDIANACNVRCTTCWHHSPMLEMSHLPSNSWKRRKMSFDTFRKIIDDLVALGGLEQIILSGMGDPSLNDQLEQMVAYVHEYEIGVTIITNLLQIDLSRLFRTPRQLDLLVSICGVSRDVWDVFHGGSLAGGFDQLLRQLEVLREARFLPKHVQVINAQNYHELVDMVRFAEQWPAKRINFKFASLSHGTEAVALNKEQKTQLLDQLVPCAKAVAEFRKIATDLDDFASQIAA